MATLDLGKVVGTRWLHGTAIDKSNYQDAIIVNEALPEEAAAGDMYLNTSTGDVFRISDPPPASDVDTTRASADVAAAEICAMLTQELYDSWEVDSLKAALVANMDDLGWVDQNHAPYDKSDDDQMELLAWILFDMSVEFRDNNETQYLDTGKPGAPVNMTWEQLQFFIINGYGMSAEYAASQGYDWKPSSEQIITPKMEMTWICNLTGPQRVHGDAGPYGEKGAAEQSGS